MAAKCFGASNSSCVNRSKTWNCSVCARFFFLNSFEIWLNLIRAFVSQRISLRNLGTLNLKSKRKEDCAPGFGGNSRKMLSMKFRCEYGVESGTDCYMALTTYRPSLAKNLILSECIVNLSSVATLQKSIINLMARLVIKKCTQHHYKLCNTLL